MSDYEDIAGHVAHRFEELEKDVQGIQGSRNGVFTARFERLARFIKKWPERKLGPLRHWLAVAALDNNQPINALPGLYGNLAKDCIPAGMTAQQKSLWGWRLYLLSKYEALEFTDVRDLTVSQAERMTSGPGAGKRVQAFVVARRRLTSDQ